MLGEKNIVAFSPELGTSNSGSQDFYPKLDLLLNEILPQNLISALYAIQRTGYYLRFFTLKNNYLECSIIEDYQHKFMSQNEDEKNELKICKDNKLQYQFSNTIALKNTGFSDFLGKIKIILLVKIDNVNFLSIKTDSGSNSHNKKINIKNKIFDRNITQLINDFNNLNKTQNNEAEVVEDNYNEKLFDVNNDMKKIIFSFNNSYFLLLEIEQENIDSQNFNLIDFKIYFDKYFIDNHLKKARSEIEKKEIVKNYENSEYTNKKDNITDNDAFKKIDFDDFLVNAFLENDFISIFQNKFKEVPQLLNFFDKKNNKTNFNNEYTNKIYNKDNNSKNQDLEEIVKNRLYFANDNYKINLNQFEIFEMKNKEIKVFSILEGFIDLLIYSCLMFFLILILFLCFYKIKIWFARREILKKMEDLPDSARSSNIDGKTYSELQSQSMENSNNIRQDFRSTFKNDF